MLSYQHEYHAGNHADVLKHVVLTLLIASLQHKATPIRVLDTHAGAGSYDLTSAAAQQHREHEHGVGLVLEAEFPIPEILPYVDTVRAMNTGGELRRYPGSPRIARSLLRPQDHLELFELHPGALEALSTSFRGDRQTHIHRRDALEGLSAVLPPSERRGMVLVDPAYESEREFAGTLRMLQSARRRWPTGIFAVWYPLVRRPGAGRFVARLETLPMARLFQIELELAAPGAGGLRGSGVIVANLPFGLDQALTAVAPWLHNVLAARREGGWRARWLTKE